MCRKKKMAHEAVSPGHEDLLQEKAAGSPAQMPKAQPPVTKRNCSRLPLFPSQTEKGSNNYLKKQASHLPNMSYSLS